VRVANVVRMAAVEPAERVLKGQNALQTINVSARAVSLIALGRIVDRMGAEGTVAFVPWVNPAPKRANVQILTV